MNIPQSSLEPFGVIGIPILKIELDIANKIGDILEKMVNDHRFEYMSPNALTAFLRIHTVRSGAYAASVGMQRLQDGEVIFKVAYQMEPNGKLYCIYPSYYPKGRL